MSDLVGNPEDRFSQNEAPVMFSHHIAHCCFNEAAFIQKKNVAKDGVVTEHFTVCLITGHLFCAKQNVLYKM